MADLIETTQAQMKRLLEERRGELIYDLRRNKERGAEIADELTDTERAITEITERERLSGSNNESNSEIKRGY